MPWPKKLSFLLIYALIPLPFIGFWAGGFYNFLTIGLLFLIVPAIDYFLQDSGNPSEETKKNLIKDQYFSNIVLLFVPVQVILLVAGVILVSKTDLSWYEWLGFTISVGMLTGGGGINLAHELMHKNNSVQQLMSKILLSTVCYGQFYIDHVRGHHVRVATPEDPSSARFGESVYHFLPRTIFGSMKSSFNLEKRRLAQKNISFLSYHNQLWWIIFAPIVLAVLSFLYGGWSALFFFLGQAIVAFTILEIVNYVEHYGLERKRLANGQYERVSAQHAWNANHWLSNMLLFHLQRHSDHHIHGANPYQILEHVEESPQLPSGYLGMMLLALIPSFWFAVMNKRVLAYRQKQAMNSAEYRGTH
ncbi:alkane 1-monooxygenase [Legionella jordanis]|uniref:alkane 1-monooxygenase n=1 Tax=Legionella jordanis TaxID=456 RepID=UPI000F005F65|nr:alkane 1-monooxygenase [Legionella jordanis]RMX21742.1 alkane 1-monooxygenase [Legionella jordanis]